MPIDTPCTKICTLNPALGICIGCGRDLDEIQRWPQLTPSERATLMEVARQRLAIVAQPCQA
jgi:predicted Fe-S protein YdhL (DUF1289 family)